MQDSVGDEDVSDDGQARRILVLSVILEQLLQLHEALPTDDDVDALVLLLVIK